jgi:hypothetical protein
LPTYRILITHEVLGISAPSSQQRRLILGFLNHLADDPFQTGDYQGKDEVGRVVQVRIIGSHALTYWVDHAAQEVKVIKIEKARRR